MVLVVGSSTATEPPPADRATIFFEVAGRTFYGFRLRTRRGAPRLTGKMQIGSLFGRSTIFRSRFFHRTPRSKPPSPRRPGASSGWKVPPIIARCRDDSVCPNDGPPHSYTHTESSALLGRLRIRIMASSWPPWKLDSSVAPPLPLLPRNRIPSQPVRHGGRHVSIGQPHTRTGNTLNRSLPMPTTVLRLISRHV